MGFIDDRNGRDEMAERLLEQQTRLECMRLAITRTQNLHVENMDELVKHADAMWNFVKGDVTSESKESK